MAGARLVAGALALVVAGAGASALLIEAGLRREWADARERVLAGDAERRARALAADFDREVARAHLWFQADSSTLTESTWDDFAFNHERWVNRAPFPALVHDWFVARPGADGVPLFRFDAADELLVPVDWPAGLHAFRDAVLAERRAGGADVMPSLGPVLGEQPAVVIELWLPEREEMPEDDDDDADDDGDESALPRDYVYLIGTLDVDFVAGSMLPTLARQHLGEGWRYRVLDGDDAMREIASNLDGAGSAPVAEVGLFAVPLAGLDEPMLDPPGDGGAGAGDAGRAAAAGSGLGYPAPRRTPEPRRGEAERERGAWRLLVYPPPGAGTAALARQKRGWALRSGLAVMVLICAAMGLAAMVLAREKRA